MRSKSWISLTVITVVVVAAAVYAVQQRQAQLDGATVATGLLFPTLLAKINDVQSISIADAKQSFTIARKAAGSADWVMHEKNDYPADPDKVKAVVVGLAELKTLEPRTAEPALYEKIGVAEIDKPGSEAVRLAVKDATGKDLAAVLLGKHKSYGSETRPGTLYVRKVGDAQSWLAQSRLEVRAEAVNWLQATILKISQDRIMAVDMRPVTGPGFSIHRDAPRQEDFTLTGLPKDVLPKISNINGITAALDLVRFEDVLPASAVDLSAAAVATYHAFDGLVVTVRTATHDGKPWSTFAVSMDAAQAAKAKATAAAPAKPAVADAAADTKPAPAVETPEQVAEEAAKLDAALKPWAYRLPDYRVANFTRSLDDMAIKPKPADGAAKTGDK